MEVPSISFGKRAQVFWRDLSLKIPISFAKPLLEHLVPRLEIDDEVRLAGLESTSVRQRAGKLAIQTELGLLQREAREDLFFGEKIVAHYRPGKVLSFSNAPLIAIFYVGATISLFAAAYTLFIVVRWLFLDTVMSGWTSVMASIWLLGGLVISFIGIVGIYLSKVFAETKRRPYTIVRSIHGRRDPA